MPTATFYRAPKTTVGGLLALLLRPSVFQYTVHLERLPGLEVRRCHYVWATDEFLVEAEYKRHRFTLEMEWGGNLVLSAPADVPQELFSEVRTHMNGYRRVWPSQVASAQRRYAQIAKSAG